MNGVVYVGSFDHNVYALNATTVDGALELHDRKQGVLFPRLRERGRLRGEL